MRCICVWAFWREFPHPCLALLEDMQKQVDDAFAELDVIEEMLRR